MTPTLALRPDLNLRVFSSEATGSLRSAIQWSRAPRALDQGSLGVLVQVDDAGVAEPLEEALVRASVPSWRDGDRYWLTGSRASLFDLSGMLLGGDADAFATELRAGLSAHSAGQRRDAATLVMGILNVTPDSFSDGGKWHDPGLAVERALTMVSEGADVIDIGGESTRPGAEEIPIDLELRRVLPVVERLREATNALLSVDTRKAEVAEACLDAGADWVNDVSGLHYDPRLAQVVAARPGTKLVLMHSLRLPGEERYSTDYDPAGQPIYEDVVADVLQWLRRQCRVATDAGVPPTNLWLDPGFGFGKSFEQNVELLQRLPEFTSAGLPLLVGTSRKSSIGRLLGDLPPDERLEGTLASVAWAATHGAACVRVHDVQATVRTLNVIDALRA